MGWGSGSQLMSEVLQAVQPPNNQKGVSVCKKLIDAFEAMDCDTLDECLGEWDAFDKAYNEFYPPEDDGDE